MFWVIIIGMNKRFLLCVSLLSILLFFGVGVSSAVAATYYSDSSGGNDNNAGSAVAPFKTFHKAYTTASSGDTIDLTGTFTWTDADETGDLVTSGYTLAKNLTITGHGPDLTIIQAISADNTADRRVFTLTTGYTTTIQNLSVRYGKVTSGNGGCILNASTLTVTNVEIYNCRSTNGLGGAISATKGFTMTGSAIYNNVVLYGGGGVHLGSATADTTILTNNTIYSNSVTASGGAFYGGGVYANGLGNIYLTNNTITANHAGGSYGIGGGLLIYNPSLHLYLANNIIAANTASYYIATSDFYTYGGTIHNNGYNVIGIAESYGWSTTGDWTDSNRDSVFVLNTAGTTGSLLFDAAAAINSNPNKTKTWGVTSGSIIINRGTASANGAVSIPITDQRGASRSGTADIGAFEYGGNFFDVTVPTITITSPTPNEATSSSMILSANVGDDQGVGGVTWYIDGVVLGSEVTSSPYSTTYDTTATSTGSHTVFAVVRDTSSNYATSSSVTFTVNNTLPTPSAVSASTSNNGATITWTTSVPASTRLWFGLTSTYASSTNEQDTGTRVTSHTATLAGLPSCVVFHYAVTGTNAVLAVATSTDSTFTTAGCAGSASITATGNSTITTSAGGTLTQGDLTLTVPTSYTATSSSTTFQANQLDSTSFFVAASRPSGLSSVGNAVFHITSLIDTTTTLSTFDAAITVTFSYTASDVVGIDENTLKIYRHDGSSWSTLSNCMVNKSLRTVSCTTTNFSDFALFGTALAVAAQSTSQSSGTTVQGRVANLLRMGYQTEAEVLKRQFPALYPIETTQPLSVPATSSTAFVFSKVLRAQMTHPDVKELQKYLNQNGFVLAQSGNGSPGNETDYFGALTQHALIKFQNAHAVEILQPIGLSIGTGLFGQMTMKFINL